MKKRKERFDELVRLIEQDSLNGQNYEWLGDYYLEENREKAYLCYENAEYFGSVDVEAVKGKMRDLEREKINKHKVSIVVLSHNARDMMIDCIESIRKNNPEGSYELVVVDNGSTDGIADWLKEQRDIVLQCNAENVGFPKGCNQGICLAEKENDIMLLNNDTIVTENSLFWLRMSLCESEVGAAGSISDIKKKTQITMCGQKARSGADFEKKEYGKEEQLQKAKYNNVLLEHPYQKTMCLVGYALMMKREALERTGYLDERFSPGNFEDSDICLRFMQQGYQLVMCYNSYIFHYGGTSFKQNHYTDIITRNFYRFNDKYGFDVDYYSRQRDDLIEHLPEDRSCKFRLLDIGCGCGNTLFRIEGIYPNAEVVGIEKFQRAVEFGEKMADIVCLDIEKQELPFKKQSFDYILMGNVLEQLVNPEKTLQYIREYLKPTGVVVTAVYNSANIKNIYGLLQGTYVETERYGLWDKKNIRCFTGMRILKLFENCGYRVQDITYLENKLSQDEEKFLEYTLKNDGRADETLLRAYNYIVIAGKDAN